MKLIINLGRLKDNNRNISEMIIKSVPHRVSGIIALKIEMTNLTQGVNARVRAPGTENPWRLATELCDRFLQRLLNGKTVFLALPADEA